MKIEIQSSNKQLMGLVLALVIVAAVGYVQSIDKNQPWHPADQIDYANIPCSSICNDANTNTNANTQCSGTHAYLDGDGNCDTLYTNSDYCGGGTCGALTVSGDIKQTSNGDYTHPSCSSWGCISTHVFTSPHYYSSSSSNTMYIGQSGNTVSIRGILLAGKGRTPIYKVTAVGCSGYFSTITFSDTCNTACCRPGRCGEGYLKCDGQCDASRHSSYSCPNTLMGYLV